MAMSLGRLVLLLCLIGAVCFLRDPGKAEYVWHTIEKLLIALFGYAVGLLRSRFSFGKNFGFRYNPRQ